MLIRLNRLSIVMLLTLALVFSVILGSSPARVNAQTGTETPTGGNQTPTLPELYKKINPSVVNIEVTIPSSADSAGLLPTVPSLPNATPEASPQDQLQFAEGSGFVYDAQGDIVTNAHVVQDATKIVVTFSDDTALIAKVVGIDPDSDLAVIKIDPTGLTLSPLTLGDSDKLEVGERAIAIGNPFGETGSMTQGIISGIGRTVEGLHSSGANSNYLIPDIVQTDAPINPGNSGGVLLNAQGEVIGVTTSIASPIRQSSGVAFAVPSNLVKKVAAALVKNGKIEHAYLGIAGQTLNLDFDQLIGLPANFHGVLVEDVTAGSPAAKAGVLPSTVSKSIDGAPVKIGGDVIVGIDDVTVKRFEDLLSYLYLKTETGQKVKLTVYRNGKTVDLDVTLTARPTQ